MEMPTTEQDALARAGDRLGQLLSTAGDCWERGDDVPPEVWREIAAVAAEVSAQATALAGARPRAWKRTNRLPRTSTDPPGIASWAASRPPPADGPVIVCKIPRQAP